MEKERDEQVIYFKDLLFATVYQWRKILIVALITALALGGWKWLTSTQDIDVNQQSAQKAYQEERLKLEEQADRLEVRLKNQLAYMNESVLMSLDPYEMYQAIAIITVSTNEETAPENEETSKADALIMMYQTALVGDSLLEEAEEKTDIPAKYIAELISLSMQAGQAQSTLCITVRHSETATAEQILEVVMHRLGELEEQFQVQMPHKLHFSVMNTVCVDQELIGIQGQAQTRLKESKNLLAEKQNELSQLKAPSVPNGGSRLKQTVLFAMVGGILGAVLVAGLACIAHIARRRVYSARTLQNRTDVKVLGCLATDRKAKADTWLRKLEGRDTEGDLTVIAAIVRNYCGTNQQLLITGDCDPANWEPVLEALRNADVRILSAGKLLSSAQALQMLTQCDAVLLVEKCDVSGYQQVNRQCALINDQNKQLIGCVLLDG